MDHNLLVILVTITQSLRALLQLHDGCHNRMPLGKNSHWTFVSGLSKFVAETWLNRIMSQTVTHDIISGRMERFVQTLLGLAVVLSLTLEEVDAHGYLRTPR